MCVRILHKVILSLENFGKNAQKSSYIFFTIISDLYKVTAIMARKSMKDSYVMKTLVPEQRLTSS